MATQKQTVQIFDGPNKFDFFAALGTGNPVHFNFGKEGPYAGSLYVQVDGARTMDGTREHWNISVHVMGKKWRGFYCTDNRKGALEYEEH